MPNICSVLDCHNQTKVSGLISKVKNIHLVGACAQLCTVLKDQEVIQQYDQLEVAAGEIGIEYTLLERCLVELENVDFVRVVRNGETVSRIEVKIPLLRGVYDDLGDLLASKKPTEFEMVNLAILDDLSLRPMTAEKIQRAYGLDASQMSMVKDLGAGAGYLANYTSPKIAEEVWFSPLHWDENPEKIMEFEKGFTSDEISTAYRQVRDYQGLPSASVEDRVLSKAVLVGCLPTASVSSLAGEKQFLFTPNTGIGSHEKSILNKARAILACVRYGQHHGTITRIRNPYVLLQALKSRKSLQPHSESINQYETLRNLGVGRLARDLVHTDRFWFHLIDNEENMKALDLSIQMVTMGDVPVLPGSVDQAREYLDPCSYQHPTAFRANYLAQERKKISFSKSTAEIVNDLLQGVSSDLIGP